MTQCLLIRNYTAHHAHIGNLLALWEFIKLLKMDWNRGESHLGFLAIKAGIPDSQNEVGSITALGYVVSFFLSDCCLQKLIGLIHSLSKSEMHVHKPSRL